MNEETIESAVAAVTARRSPAPDVSADMRAPVGLIVLAGSTGALAVASLLAAVYLAVVGAL
ncbi:hypothetical protein [Microbacterium sp.]|jgi:hypothetical protein|uniref:hypothetical protein n=1 Tax=Microbacterium sp. TaxID=51671 RepID=UPI0037C77692